MLKRETVLVLGAGSSVDYGILEGSGLIKEIAQNFAFPWSKGVALTPKQQANYGALARAGFTEDAIRSYGRRLAEAAFGSTSIDDVLFRLSSDINPHAGSVILFGKMAIILEIARAESDSHLIGNKGAPVSQHAPNFEGLSTDWLHLLLSYLIREVRSPQEIFKRLKIINFNYDRVVPYHLYHALQRLYGIDGKQAARAVSTLQIYHPYGRIGRLPWQAERDDQDESPVFFGAATEDLPLRDLADQIKTFTEREQNPDVMFEARSALSRCEQLIFLGFGFHPQNAELLQNTAPPNLRAVFASTYKMSSPDVDVMNRRIASILGRNFLAEDLGAKAERFVRVYVQEWMEP